jgi:hypothetical protein
LRVGEDRQALGDEPLWSYGKTIRLRQTQSAKAGPSDGAVSLDGRPLAIKPVSDLPLNGRYFLR